MKNVGAAEGDGQIAADDPQHAHEGRRGEHGAQDADREIDRLLGRDADVLGDARFRVLVVALDQVELVVAPLGEPARHRVLGEPGAPAPLHAHARVDHAHRDRDAAGGERDEDHRLAQDGRAVLLLQRVEDRLVPEVELVLEDELPDHQRDQAGGHQPGDLPAPFGGPEAARGAPEAAHQRLLPARAPLVLLCHEKSVFPWLKPSSVRQRGKVPKVQFGGAAGRARPCPHEFGMSAPPPTAARKRTSENRRYGQKKCDSGYCAAREFHPCIGCQLRHARPRFMVRTNLGMHPCSARHAKLGNYYVTQARVCIRPRIA